MIMRYIELGQVEEALKDMEKNFDNFKKEFRAKANLKTRCVSVNVTDEAEEKKLKRLKESGRLQQRICHELDKEEAWSYPPQPVQILLQEINIFLGSVGIDE